MKKIVFTLMMMLPLCGIAQTGEVYSLDTLPPFYYSEHWNCTRWIPENGMLYVGNEGYGVWYSCSFLWATPDSSHSLNYTGGPYIGISPYINLRDYPQRPRNIAVGMSTQEPLKVVGVAALLWPWDCQQFIDAGYNSLTLQLLDSNMNPLASANAAFADSLQFSRFTIARGRMFRAPTNQLRPWDFYAYEVLFDDPVTVSDSFYIAGYSEIRKPSSDTVYSSALPLLICHEFLMREIGMPAREVYHFPELNYKIQGGATVQLIPHPMPNNPSYYYTNIQCVAAPTEWHKLSPFVDYGLAFVFPILSSECDGPREFTMEDIGYGIVKLDWDRAGLQRRWEVSYGPAGTPPGMGTVQETTIPSALIRTAEPGNYVAYVRSMCCARDTSWSDWGDSISVVVTSSAGLPQTALADNIVLTPNPASGRVDVTSGVELFRIEAYDDKGCLTETCNVSGHKATLDVSFWTSGTYLLRITTPMGTVTKKLLVQ